MIAMARSITHGINYLNYISGEAEKKTRPDLIRRICDNLIEPLLDPMGIWMSMQLTVSRYPRPMENSLIEVVLSPSPEHTKSFTDKDWQELWKDFAREFDSLEYTATKGKRKGKIFSRKTNISNSKSTVWLHQDSASSTPHLHAAVCRVDKDGNINNDHHIAQRAQDAAERVAIKRGWVTAKGVREKNLSLLRKECEDILRKMPNWSWPDFKDALEPNGHEVWTRRDNAGKLVAWAIVNGNAKYNSSKIHQRLAPGKIYDYWRELRGKELKKIADERARLQRQSQPKPAPKPATPPAPPKQAPWERYSAPRNNADHLDLRIGDKSYPLYIPKEVVELFSNTYSEYDYSNSESLFAKCIALFVELALPPEAPTVGGGGGSSDNDKDWGRDPKEDEIQWAMRCAKAAAVMAKPIKKMKTRR